MATGASHVRVVRCPKCPKLLLEVANLPVYSCGGCGALLQAKTRKNDAKIAESGLHETDVALPNELNHVVAGEVSSSSSSPEAKNELNQSLPSAGAQSEEEAKNESVDSLAHETVSFHNMEPTGTLATTDHGSPRSDLSGVSRDMMKPPTIRGSHGYEAGSVSSCDGLEDEVSDRFRADDIAVSEEKLRRDRFLVDSMRSVDSDMQNQPRNKKLHAMKGKGWDHDELWEPTTHRHPPRNKFPPTVPQHGSGSFPSQVHEDLEYKEQEKMKLLRIIYELQDQLDKSCNLEGKTNGRGGVTGKEKNSSAFYNHNEFKYPSHPGKTRVGANSAQQFKHSQCLHCQPQEWQCSAQFPPLCHKKALCGIHHVRNCSNPYNTCTSCPQKCMEPEFSTKGQETNLDDVMRKYSKGKHLVAKRHFRPKAGGAPFVNCYHCSKLLQLPEDFLLFKRRYYRLKCGACSTILKYSVQQRTHITPYSPDSVDPPPSAVDEDSGVMTRMSTALSSRGSNCPCADPVSDDYGLAFCRSCSTGGDHVSHTPLHTLQDSSSDARKMYAKKEFHRRQFRNKYKVPEETYGSPYSEIEVVQPRSSSPLHRLMGYSSPSVVIRGSDHLLQAQYLNTRKRNMR